MSAPRPDLFAAILMPQREGAGLRAFASAIGALYLALACVALAASGASMQRVPSPPEPPMVALLGALKLAGRNEPMDDPATSLALPDGASPERVPDPAPRLKPDPDRRRIKTPDKPAVVPEVAPTVTATPTPVEEQKPTPVPAPVDHAGSDTGETTSQRASAPGSAVGGGAAANGSGISGTRDGTANGAAGGARGGTARQQMEVLPFTDGMTRPELIVTSAPAYTREAREARVEGLVLAKCVITTRGRLENCRIIKGLPLMDHAVLKALAGWQYTPVMYRGKPVNVDYVVRLRLVPP